MAASATSQTKASAATQTKGAAQTAGPVSSVTTTPHARTPGVARPRGSYIVIRVRGTVNITKKTRDTLTMMRLTRPNHAVVLPMDPSTEGMIHRVKDYVTYGEIDAQTAAELLKARGRAMGDKPFDDAWISKATASKFKTLAEFASALASGKAKMKELGEARNTERDGDSEAESDARTAKMVFRLHPPTGGHAPIKHHFTVGGALGYRGKAINELVRRMI
ncbi:MAG: 50S ribosomal protein L30 [Thermoplasmatota archaeon]